MRWARFIGVISLWSFFFAIVVLVRPWVSLFNVQLGWRILSRLAQSLSSLLIFLLQVKIVLEGDTRPMGSRGQVVVSNHLGYLDGLILGSLFPSIFVSKNAVRKWPLIGQWLVLIGAVFVDRKKRERILQVIGEITQKLRRGTNVLLFPEGTSTNGDRLLPFQPAFFAAPLIACADVVPVTLTYQKLDGRPLTNANRDRLYWYGDMDFGPHFLKLLGARKIEVRVRIHSKIETRHLPNDSKSRKELSRTCHAIISGDSSPDNRSVQPESSSYPEEHRRIMEVGKSRRSGL